MFERVRHLSILIAVVVILGGGATAAERTTLAYWCLDGNDFSNAADPAFAALSPISADTADPLGVTASYRAAQTLVPDLRRENSGSLFFPGNAGLRASAIGDALDLSGPFTVEGWFRPAAIPDGIAALFAVASSNKTDATTAAPDKGPETSRPGSWSLGLTREGFTLTVNGTSKTFAAPPTLDWTYFALTFTPEAQNGLGGWTLWRNDRKVGTFTSAAVPAVLSHPCAFTLGATAAGVSAFFGELDLWRVSTVCIEPDASLYAQRAKPVSLWPLASDGSDALGGAIALKPCKDGGVSFAVPAPTNAPAPDSARGGCAAMSGGLGTRSLLCAEGLGSVCDWTRGFTAEGWFRKNGDPDDRRPWYLAGARDDADGWSLFLNKTPEGRVRFSLYVCDVTSGGHSQFEEFFPHTDLTGDGAWHHVALVCDPCFAGRGAWILYLDGVWSGTIQNHSALTKPHGFPDFLLGGRPSFSNSFVGWLSGWRLTNGPLQSDALLCLGTDSPRPRSSAKANPADARDLANALAVMCSGLCGRPNVETISSNRFLCVTTESVTQPDTDSTNAPPSQIIARICDGTKTGKPVTLDTGADATTFSTPFDRIYVFYANALPAATAAAKNASPASLVFRYTDDEGSTWSESFPAPFRKTAFDHRNSTHGENIRFTIADKPVRCGNAVCLALTKFGSDTANESEGWILSSPNLLTERNASRVKFETFPLGGQGIRNPEFGVHQDGHALVPLKGNALMCIFRTDGNPAQCFSSDNGKTWSMPERMTYGTGLREIQSFSALPRVLCTDENRYAMLFSNSGDNGSGATPTFVSRGALDDSGRIRWSEPEILFHDSSGNRATEAANTDFVKTGNGWWTVAVNRLNKYELLAARAPALLDAQGAQTNPGQGFTLALTVDTRQATDGETLYSTMDGRKGIRVTQFTMSRNRLVWQIDLFDGDISATWRSDPKPAPASGTTQVSFVCDFRARVISVLTDGVLNDGAGERPCGWGRIPAAMAMPGTPERVATVSAAVKQFAFTPMR